MSSAAKQEYVAQEKVDLTPGEAFRLFTERVDAWYEINSHSVLNPEKTSAVEIEGYVGGRFMEVPTSTSDSAGVLGTIHTWDPPNRFVFIDLNECEVAVTFEPVDKVTLVTISVRVVKPLSCKKVNAIKRYGWHTLLRQYTTIINQPETSEGYGQD
ncbi:MAG: SRPBCC domain-containing protein [bacterium]